MTELKKGRADEKDQFFTTAADALDGWQFLHEEADIPADARYVDPCAGGGAFLRLMPHDRRLGFDLEVQPGMEGDVTEQDFLQLDPLNNPLPAGFVAASNPPFGFRASMAIAFINKCFELGASYVGFVLPAGLIPDAEGPPINERRLIDCHSIAHWGPINYFELPNGKRYEVNACGFVVYQRGRRPKPAPGATCDSYIRMHGISTYAHHEAKRRGPIEYCDLFVRSSRFKTEKRPVLVDQPDREGRWIGIEILREEARQALESLDWESMGREGAMRNVCICPRHVTRALLEAGLRDDGVVARPKPRAADPEFDLC